MIRNLKAFVLATMALAALGAVTAGAAQAHTPAEFTSDANQTTITSTADGTGKTAHHVLDLAGGTVTCSASFHGTQVGKTATSITLTVTYTGCTLLGQPATVTMMGCDFIFYADGSFDIHPDGAGTCATGVDPITLNIPGCLVEIPKQTGLKTLKYNTIKPGSFHELTVQAEVKGIHYDATGANCPKVGTYTDGEFTTGNTIITGTDTATGLMTNITWSATVA